jgi:hypothetical protein
MPSPPVSEWTVWDGPLLVLTIIGRAGPLVSMAAPPPGPAEFRTHPFLSATSSSPLHEDRLHRLLAASHSVDEFLERLRAVGLVVREEAPTP